MLSTVGSGGVLFCFEQDDGACLVKDAMVIAGSRYGI